MQVSSPYELEDFQILQVIGQGSFSKVKLVRRKNDNKLMALKQVNMDKLGIYQRNLALNQIRLLASVKSPFVISYQGSFYSSSTNTLCLMMQYAQDGDLESIINKSAKKSKMQKGLSQNFIWRTIIHLLQGLKVLHQNNIVHRDIKPANIFYNKGIAKLGDLNVSAVSNSQLYKTKTGTPYYTAPQIWKGQQYTTKCDIWSLGCIIYQMCALLPPFRAQTFPELFISVSKGQYITLSEDYSDAIRTFIRMCLVVQQSQRFSASQLLSGPIMIKKLTQFKDDINFNSKVQIIKPLKCPKVLRFINQILPQTNSQTNELNNQLRLHKLDFKVKKVKLQNKEGDHNEQNTKKKPNYQNSNSIRIRQHYHIKKEINLPKSQKLIKLQTVSHKFIKQQSLQEQKELKTLKNLNSTIKQNKNPIKNTNFRLRSCKKIPQKENITNF